MSEKPQPQEPEIVLTRSEVEQLKAMLMDAELSVSAVKYYLALKTASARTSPGDLPTLKNELGGGGTPCGRRLAERVGGPPCLEAYDEST